MRSPHGEVRRGKVRVVPVGSSTICRSYAPNTGLARSDIFRANDAIFSTSQCWRATCLKQERRAQRAIGFNHVALEVGDIEEALRFYGQLFDFELRAKSSTSAFIDLGDQFLALQKGRTQPADDGRHFGLVVDDKDAVRRALADAGIQSLPGQFLDFLDPWGNRIEIVGYDNIQFTKAPSVLRGMGLAHVSKNKKAIKELTDKGMAPD
jgi:lactoylglutathione lyase